MSAAKATSINEDTLLPRSLIDPYDRPVAVFIGRGDTQNAVEYELPFGVECVNVDSQEFVRPDIVADIDTPEGRKHVAAVLESKGQTPILIQFDWSVTKFMQNDHEALYAGLAAMLPEDGVFVVPPSSNGGCINFRYDDKCRRVHEEVSSDLHITIVGATSDFADYAKLRSSRDYHQAMDRAHRIIHEEYHRFLAMAGLHEIRVHYDTLYPFCRKGAAGFDPVSTFFVCRK